MAVEPAALIGVSESAMTSDSDVVRLVALYDKLRAWIIRSVEPDLVQLQRDNAWGLLHAMSGRVIEQQAACISLYSHGYFAPAEALCRTVVEGAVNLYYCSLGDSCKLVLTYFRSYIETERKQSKQWLSSVNASTHEEEAKQSHRDRITGKEEALGAYERVLTEAFAQIGEHYAQAGKEWPSVFDRFRAIGKETAYRTVYAALCSQAHNDAEDLLNDFVHGVTQVPGAHEAQSKENKNFALYMVLTAFSLLAEAAAMYLAKFSLLKDETFKEIVTDTLSFTEEVTERKFVLR